MYGTMKTLVVDDDPVSRILMKKIMSKLGECEAADCGDAAIKAFIKSLEIRKPFDLIALDISMPDMTGTEVLKKIRKIEEKLNTAKERQVKVLMVTAHSDQAYVVSSIAAGCDDYIVKPYTKATILEKLEKLGLKV